MSRFCNLRGWFALILLSATASLAYINDTTAAPYAAVVMDARNGKILHSSSAQTRLHPASLTKMMTLYIAFEAAENGEIDLDDKVLISKNAASEVPSKMYYKAGTKVSFRYLIRAAALRSANDAATAIGEAIEGSEKAFTQRMNIVAKMMGMKNTNFKNAHGLTANDHYSTAYDMSILGRHMIYDYPEYFHLFSRINMYASGTQIYNTNRRFLRDYQGSDGIKTGFTNKAGFNLVATAKRGNTRIITTVFGGKSVATRNNEVARLMDIGFQKATSNVRLVKPKKPLPSRFSLNGVLLAEIDVPRNRPFQGNPNQTQIANVDTGFNLGSFILEAQQELLSVGDASVPLTPEEEAASLFKDIPNRPVQLTALNGLEDLTRNAGINLGLYYSKQLADRKSIEVYLATANDLKSPVKEQIIEERSNFRLQYVWMTKEEAIKVCQTLKHRKIKCEVMYFH